LLPLPADFFASCQLDADREVQQGKNLVDAAKAGGVKHFVWSTLDDTRPALSGKRPALDSAGRTVPHFDSKAEIEAYLKEQVRSARRRHGQQPYIHSLWLIAQCGSMCTFLSIAGWQMCGASLLLSALSLHGWSA
jgi:hypothetical protein